MAGTIEVMESRHGVNYQRGAKPVFFAPQILAPCEVNRRKHNFATPFSVIHFSTYFSMRPHWIAQNFDQNVSIMGQTYFSTKKYEIRHQRATSVAGMYSVLHLILIYN